ncbi:hypothetical protein JCM19992_10660 [Thermostilla marina]
MNALFPGPGWMPPTARRAGLIRINLRPTKSSRRSNLQRMNWNPPPNRLP